MIKNILARIHRMREVAGRRYSRHPDGTLPGDPAGVFNLLTTALSVQTDQNGTLTVARTQSAVGAVAVDWAVAGATTTPQSGTLTWANGDGSNKSASLVMGAVGSGSVTLSNPRRTSGTGPAPTIGVGSGVLTITALPGPAWNLPTTISIQAGASVDVRQYALNSDEWTLNVTGLAAGLIWDAVEETITAAGDVSSSTATFTMSKVGEADIVAAATVASIAVPTANLGTLTINPSSASSFIHDAAEGYALEFRVTRSGATSGVGSVSVDWEFQGFDVVGESIGTVNLSGNGYVNVSRRLPFHGQETKVGQLVLSNPRRTDGEPGSPAINVGTRVMTARASVPGDMSCVSEEPHYSDIKGVGGWPTIRAYPGRPFYIRAKRGERSACAVDWIASGVSITPSSGTISFAFAEQTYLTKAIPVVANAVGIGSITLLNPRRTDEGLNAPTLSAAVIPVEVLSGSPPSWLLPDGHYIPAKMPMKVIHPRSFPGNDETTPEARHKNAYPGLLYHIPVSVQGGAYPFHYELLAGPSGMTLGQTVDADDYGEVKWANPTAGNHTVRVLITDQELNQRTVEYTLGVAVDRFVFVDPSVVTSGDGTIGSPLKTFTELHGGFYPKRSDAWPASPYFNPGVNTYARKLVYLRAGVHQVADIPTPWLSFDNDRPHALLGYPGENVELDGTMGKITVSAPDFFVGGMTIRKSAELSLLWGGHWSITSRTSGINSKLYAMDNSWEMENSSRNFQMGTYADRATFMDLLFAECRNRAAYSTAHPSLGTGGNNAPIQGNSMRTVSSSPTTPKAFEWREYYTFWDWRMRGCHTQLTNMYTFFYGVAEKLRTLPDLEGESPMDPKFRLQFAKSTNDFWSYRRCVAVLHPHATAPSDSGILYLQMSNTHHHTRPIRQEACYNLLHSVGQADGIVFKYNQGAGGNDTNVEGNKTWSYRNTLIGRQMGYNRFYDVNFEDNVQFISTVEFTGQPYPETRTNAEAYVLNAGITGLPADWEMYLDSEYKLKAPYRAVNLGKVGHEISGGA